MTSLSTIGFGDLYPVNEFERFVAAFTLLIGVAIFSYIMNEFSDTMDIRLKVNEDLDDSDNLNKFFDCIKKFNNGVTMDEHLQERIQQFFEYKWKADMN